MVLRWTKASISRFTVARSAVVEKRFRNVCAERWSRVCVHSRCSTGRNRRSQTSNAFLLRSWAGLHVRSKRVLVSYKLFKITHSIITFAFAFAFPWLFSHNVSFHYFFFFSSNRFLIIIIILKQWCFAFYSQTIQFARGAGEGKTCCRRKLCGCWCSWRFEHHIIGFGALCAAIFSGRQSSISRFVSTIIFFVSALSLIVNDMFNVPFCHFSFKNSQWKCSS